MKTLMMAMAFQYLNVPYQWGGNNYDGMDCSGFVLKVLHDSGYTLPDMTAQSLYEHCLKNGNESSTECDALLFFGASEKEITHVSISIGEIDGIPLMIEAGGAGSNSLKMSKKELAVIDARVRIKPIDNRRDLIAGLKIPYKKGVL